MPVERISGFFVCCSWWIRGKFVKPLEISEFYSVNIDEEVDFFKAEALINSNKYKKELDVFDKLKFKYEA